MAHPSQLARPNYSLTVGGQHVFAKCWRITRADATVFRFTDWSHELDVGGATYTPLGSFESSAEEGVEGLTPGNRELKGILRSDKITEDDLRAGRYRRARVDEFIVDPRWPWVGILRTNLYWIQETKFNGEMWEAQLEGPLNRLRVTKGFTYERRCRWENFGDSNCGFAVAGVTVSGAAVTAVDEAYKQIQTDVATGNGDDYYSDGRITWVTGDNAGLISDVKDYTELNGVLRLYVEPPFAIQVGDTFDLVPGCDRQFATCVGKYNNKDNFGGFPQIPGNDDLFNSPDAPLDDEE